MEGYPQKVADFDYKLNLNFHYNCAFWDISSGAVLEFTDCVDGRSLIGGAVKGFNKLSFQ